MKIKACLTHKTDNWATPKKIYDHFMKINYFDPCPLNAKFNGLEIEWKEINFVNPPYSQIKKWIDKAIKEKEKGKHILMLLPARTDTKWFEKLCENNAEIIFIKGRLHFNDSKSAPFPSMLVRLNNKIDYNYMYLKDKEYLERVL